MKLFRNILILFTFLSISIFSNTYGNFFWKCNAKQRCNLYALTDKGKKILILSDWNHTDIGNAAFKYYQNNLGKVSYSCGSPCSYTTFVDFKSGNISDSYFLVTAIDPQRFLIAFPDPTDKEDNTLKITHIFHSKKSIKIKKDFSHGVSISLEKAKFIDNNLYIEYQGGENFEEHKENIPVHFQ